MHEGSTETRPRCNVSRKQSFRCSSGHLSPRVSIITDVSIVQRAPTSTKLTSSDKRPASQRTNGLTFERSNGPASNVPTSNVQTETPHVQGPRYEPPATDVQSPTSEGPKVGRSEGPTSNIQHPTSNRQTCERPAAHVQRPTSHFQRPNIQRPTC